jgi:hypothetical protein
VGALKPFPQPAPLVHSARRGKSLGAKPAVTQCVESESQSILDLGVSIRLSLGTRQKLFVEGKNLFPTILCLLYPIVRAVPGKKCVSRAVVTMEFVILAEPL